MGGCLGVVGGSVPLRAFGQFVGYGAGARGVIEGCSRVDVELYGALCCGGLAVLLFVCGYEHVVRLAGLADFLCGDRGEEDIVFG